MIRQAQQLAEGFANVRFESAELRRSVEDGAFTAVLCSNSFHHYPDPARAVREMARVFASGGRIAIGDACSDRTAARVADVFLRRFEPGHVRLYRSDELGSFVRDAGLSRVELKRLSDGGSAIVRGVAA